MLFDSSINKFSSHSLKFQLLALKRRRKVLVIETGGFSQDEIILRVPADCEELVRNEVISKYTFGHIK